MENTSLVEGQFGHGGAIDSVDDRDYDWDEIGAAAPIFDWQKGFDIEQELADRLGIPDFKIPVKNQGQSGSCGGQAWSNYGQILEAFATGTFEERSAKFIYAQTFVPPWGSNGRPNCEIAINQGWGLEALTPSYDNGNPPSEEFMERVQDITPQARTEAGKAKALLYANAPADIDAIAQAASLNHGIVIGLGGKNNGTWLSAFPIPPAKGEIATWGHWIYVGKAKLVNGVKKLMILNSWGDKIGIGGWQWIGEDYFANGHVWRGWLMAYKMQAALPEKFTHAFKADIISGTRNAEVKALQIALQIDGCFDKGVPTTGYYGNITRNAVLKFQQKYKVASDAELTQLNGRRVGPKTRTKLNELFGV